MAAPLGFKTFATGDVLTAADTNGYLMQGIWVFADATARDAAVTSPQEGNACYLKSTDEIMVYSGSAWVTKSGSPAATANLLLNSNFAINQRAYVSAANLASGSYGFDRWKSNFTNTTLTFTASTQGQSLTINSGGGLQQVIEQGLVPSGTYTLSWTGTATARVYNSGGTPPSYAASPVTFTADGTANVVVEFTASGGTRTVSKVQFNSGTGTTWALATPTLQSELAACQRYYQRVVAASSGTPYTVLGTGTANGTATCFIKVYFPVSMRTAPSAVDTSAMGTFFLQSGSVSSNTPTTLALSGNSASSPTIGCIDWSKAGSVTDRGVYDLLANGVTTSYVGFSAEL